MTATRLDVQAIYDQMEALVVTLDMTAELGPTYFQERLLTTRQAMETVATLTVQITRELSAVKLDIRGLTVSQRLAKRASASVQADQLATQIDDLRGRAEELSYLLAAVKVRKDSIRTTLSNIRLMMHTMETLKGIGGAVPPREGQVTDISDPSEHRLREGPTPQPTATTVTREIDVPLPGLDVAIAPPGKTLAERQREMDEEAEQARMTLAEAPTPLKPPSVTVLNDEVDISKLLGD